ncbi:MAG: hypothetical protein IJ180_07925 [Bacteroidales bacterium]|nr:hypothetical protein [Bacteroidales bacterium]
MDIVYKIGEGFFSTQLFDYLRGYTSRYQGSNLFNGIFACSFVVSILIFFLYYYVIGHYGSPRWARLKYWVIVLIFNFVVNLIGPSMFCKNEMRNGKMVKLDPSTEENISLQITSIDCWMFGLYNAILFSVIFFIICIIFKKWSTNISHIPFK